MQGISLRAGVATSIVLKGSGVAKNGLEKSAAAAISIGIAIETYAIGDEIVYLFAGGVGKVTISENVVLATNRELTPDGAGKWKNAALGDNVGAVAIYSGLTGDEMDVIVANYPKQVTGTSDSTDLNDTPASRDTKTEWVIKFDSSAFIAMGKYVTKIADYTATETDEYIAADGNVAGVTITLPTAVGIDGKEYIIKAIDISNTVLVDGHGAQTIDGNANHTFTTQYETITVRSNGLNWDILTESGNDYTKAEIDAKITAYVKKIADYTADADDYRIEGDGNAAGVTVTLPTAVGIQGKSYLIKATDLTNTVKIATNGAETIDGSTSDYTFVTKYETLELLSDGTNWLIINKFIDAPMKMYVKKQANYTALLTDRMIELDGNAAVVGITLPTAVGCAGKMYELKATDMANALTIVPHGAQTIDGESGFTFTYLYECINIISDGTNWLVIGKYDNLKVPYVKKIADYTALLTDMVIEGDGNAAGVTVTLPTAAGIAGRQYIIKATDITNPVVVDGHGGETIDGAATYTFATANECIRIVSDGTNWLIITQMGNDYTIAQIDAKITAYIAKQGHYTTLITDNMIVSDGSLAVVDITLITAAGNTGKEYIIKCIDKTNACRILTNGGETIDGAANLTFAAQWDCVILKSDGVNWLIVARE